MENIFVESYIQKLVEKGFIREGEESRKFELLSNYLFLTKGNNDLELEDFLLEKGYEELDSIGIKINGDLFSLSQTEEIIQAFSEETRVELIFIQSKRSGSFSRETLNGIINATKKFISEKLDVFKGKFEKFDDYKLFIYYVTCGKYVENDFSSTLKDNEDFSDFKQVSINLIGVEELQDTYRKIKTKSEVVFELLSISQIDVDDEKIKKAYIGIIDYENLKAILEKNEYSFFDNIRDDLKNNINKEIEKSTKENPSIFCLLNNGLTILSDVPINIRSGNRFSLKDYQVVNGCQTCSVLKEANNPKISIPVKILYTSDESIKGKIIHSTNNQSSISKEQLQAIYSFQKSLEEFFPEQKPPLYYERREKQYSDKKRIEYITIRELIKVMSGTFLNNPEISGYFKKYWEENQKNLFQKGHKHILYYIGALLCKKFESLKKNVPELKEYNMARYHIFYSSRLIFEKEKEISLPDAWNNKRIEEYSESFQKELADDDFCKSLFQKALKIIKIRLPEHSQIKDIRKEFYAKHFSEDIRMYIRNNDIINETEIKD